MVLDTNVVLDLWLFCDRRVCALAHAILTDQIRVFTDPGCTEELHRVLGYPVFALDAGDQAALLAGYRSVALEVGYSEAQFKVSPAQCSDPDDQKFLDLAWRTGADLLTRDKAILVLRRRYAALGGGTICEPERLFPPGEPPSSGTTIRATRMRASANTDLGHNFASAPRAASPRRRAFELVQPKET